jgi:hypothetical protein
LETVREELLQETQFGDLEDYYSENSAEEEEEESKSENPMMRRFRTQTQRVDSSFHNRDI